MTIRVLITDDHAVFRSGLHALLDKEEGIEVVAEAGSGMDALKILQTQEVDVLLLDLSLPGISGAKTAETALSLKPHLAIVVLSMHEEEQYVRELFRVGASGYVLKKSTGTELVQALHAVHRGDNYVDPALANLLVSPYAGRHRPAHTTRPDVLTPREREVCTHVALGYTNAEIADMLRISARTVETHRTNIMTKLDLKNRAQLVRFALDQGLLGTG